MGTHEWGASRARTSRLSGLKEVQEVDAAALRTREVPGSLVITTPARLDGAEIEIRREGTPWTGAHADVRERGTRDHAHYAVVFPELAAGGYEVRMLGAASGVVVPISITPGAVVETWLDAPVD